MLGLVQLKTYLYATLVADVSLSNLMNGVKIYDLVQKNAALPYITYGKIISRNLHALDAPVAEHIVHFSVVSKADSSLTTHNIMARLEQIFELLLDEEDLTGGFRLMSVDLLETGIEQVDFDIVKGAMKLKFLIEAGV